MCTPLINKPEKKENVSSYQMAIFTYGVGAAQTVHTVVDVLLTSRPGIARIAEAVEAVYH